ncbi:unnamed protein product, partial [Brachionus calyciflorus]
MLRDRWSHMTKFKKNGMKIIQIPCNGSNDDEH